MKSDYLLENPTPEVEARLSAYVQALSCILTFLEGRQALLKEELDFIRPAYYTSEFKRKFKECLTDLNTVAAGLFVMHKMLSELIAAKSDALFCGCGAEGSIN